ncbi:MAG: hypothetical protein IK057_04670 [Clostridia bacterium]|nr:hypothetical protein [Clostridia bacterium]
MKTLEEFINEINASKELQEELKNASCEMLDAFLKKHGCGATAKDFTAFIKSKAEGEIEDDDVEAIAGGIYSQSIKPPTPMPMP